MWENTYLLLDMTFNWSTVYFNSRSVLADAVDDAIQDLQLSWLKSKHIESNIEDNIACGVLHYSFKVVLLLEMVLQNVNDVSKLFCALADEKLVDSIRRGIISNDFNRQLRAKMIVD